MRTERFHPAFEKFLDKLLSNSPRRKTPDNHEGVNRRDFIQLTALAGAGASLAGALPTSALAQTSGAPSQFNEVTVAQLQAAMAAGSTNSVQLTNFYLSRILALDQRGPGLNSVIELNPDALAIAQQADKLRGQGKVLGPLHGIPILLKDNIDTGDRMQTTAGSFALAGAPAVRDSTIAAKLRAGGAIILGLPTKSCSSSGRRSSSSPSRSTSAAPMRHSQSLAASATTMRSTSIRRPPTMASISR
jgi:amidase